MKKVTVIGLFALTLCLAASLAFAAVTHKKGVVKSVDEKAGTIVLTIDGKDMTYKADKDVDLSKCKEGKKVGVMVDGDMVKHIAPKKPRASVGC